MTKASKGQVPGRRFGCSSLRRSTRPRCGWGRTASPRRRWTSTTCPESSYITKIIHSSTRDYLVRILRFGRTALCCYSVIKVVIGCIPIIKWEEIVVEGSYKKGINYIRWIFYWGSTPATSKRFYLEPELEYVSMFVTYLQMCQKQVSIISVW